LDKLVLLAVRFSVSTDYLLGLREAPERDAPEAEENRIQLLFIGLARRLWYNIGYFMLIWGALIALMAAVFSRIWGEAAPAFVRPVVFIGVFAFICGLVLVLFRLRRKN
jgi:hypothetical protein